MANEDKKDFNAMLHDSKVMPKVHSASAIFLYAFLVGNGLKFRHILAIM